MMGFLRTAILVLLFRVCLAAGGDLGVEPGSVPVETVFGGASLVCNCFVESLEDHTYPIEVRGRASTRHEVTARVATRDVYKSDDFRITNFTVQYVVDEQEGQRVGGSRLGLLKGETVLLFLTKTGTDTYEFANPFIGATQFSSLPIQEGDLGLLRLQRVLMMVVQRSEPLDQLRALRVLLGFDHITDDTLSAVTPLTQSDNPDIALTALGVLLRTKSVDSVERLERYLESHTSRAEPSALFVIGPELGQISSAKALPALEALSGSKILSIRHGAMDAIRKIRSPKSVRFLMAKLDDPDSTVQYVALITTAEILGKYEGDFAPSMYLFDKKPQYYLGLWKQWWAEEGSKLYPPDSDRSRPSAKVD
jgi:hypothetical protein